MRPVTKISWPEDEDGNRIVYKPHTIAKGYLEGHLGFYCSYCEVFSSDLEVEHIISKHQDSTLYNNWDNFLQACGRCNGRDNKSNKPVNFDLLHFPHLNNTFKSFTYKEGGFVTVNGSLVGDSLTRATALFSLVGLDKIPGSPTYTNYRDSRWMHRRNAWEHAKARLADYEAQRLDADQVVEFATLRGFFSVWFTVFENHPAVRQLLIQEFKGTTSACFDAASGYQPVNRNPANLSDPI